jgi:hypothetical protein
LCIETFKELRTRQAEAVYEEHADQSLTKQIVTCGMDTAYPIRNTYEAALLTGLVIGVKTIFFFWAARALPTPFPTAAPTLIIAKINKRIRCRFYQISCLSGGGRTASS